MCDFWFKLLFIYIFYAPINVQLKTRFEREKKSVRNVTFIIIN